MDVEHSCFKHRFQNFSSSFYSLKMTDVSDRQFSPGAARFGNFINYYEFNSPKNRLQVLPTDMLVKLGFDSNKPVIALDVGCNSGDMTVALLNLFARTSETEHKSNVQFLGVDLDPILITRAKEKYCQEDRITFSTIDIMGGGSKDFLRDFLSKFEKENFDVTFCLSISMWIHLNYGDAGLERLLHTLCEITEYLVIEPQPWKCYKTALRRASRLNQAKFEHFETLKIRENITDFICDFLKNQCNMVLLEFCGKTTWDRPMLIFRKSKQ